jgi:hypothetical protein
VVFVPVDEIADEKKARECHTEDRDCDRVVKAKQELAEQVPADPEDTRPQDGPLTNLAVQDPR